MGRPPHRVAYVRRPLALFTLKASTWTTVNVDHLPCIRLGAVAGLNDWPAHEAGLVRLLNEYLRKFLAQANARPSPPTTTRRIRNSRAAPGLATPENPAQTRASQGVCL